MCAHAYSFVCFWLTELCDFITPVYIINGAERILVIPIQDFRQLQLSPVCSFRTPALWTNFCLPYCSCWWICHWGTVNLISKLQASVWPVSSSLVVAAAKIGSILDTQIKIVWKKETMIWASQFRFWASTLYVRTFSWELSVQSFGTPMASNLWRTFQSVLAVHYSLMTLYMDHKQSE